jgi:AmiR/NasT family two-component response regulator
MTDRRELLRSMRHLRVLVLHPPDDEGNELVHQIRRIGCPVRQIWPPPAALPDDVDAVFFLVDHEHLGYRPWRPGERPVALIAVLGYEDPGSLGVVIDTHAHAVVGKPIRPFGILANLALARASHAYEQRLQARIARLDETLRARRTVERATRMLTSLLGVCESEAYGVLRKEAMAKRVPIGTLAEAVVNASGLLGELARRPNAESDVDSPLPPRDSGDAAP